MNSDKSESSASSNARCRKWFIGALVLVTGLTTMSVETSFAQECVELAGKRLRWIVPNRPGGGYDTYSRLIAPYFGATLRADVAVENVLGAGGIVGSAALRDAKPDGLTVGILDGAGLLAAALAGASGAPKPSKDFTILGRIARSQHIWATGKGSSFKSIEDVFAVLKQRRIVFGIRDVGSNSFVSISIGASLLDIEPAFVAGFSGSGAAALAAIRGDVDIISLSFSSILKNLETEDLRPLLQISEERIAPHPSLDGVPTIGGNGGLAVRHAAAAGRSTDTAHDDAAALVALVSAGRLVVAPLNLEDHIRICLERALYSAMSDPEFQKTAADNRRSLDIADGKTTAAALRAVDGRIRAFIPIIRRSIQETRN